MPSSLFRSCLPTIHTIYTTHEKQVTLDIVLPIVALVALLKLVDWAADQARAEIDARVAGDRDVVEELQRKSTLSCMVLLAMRTPAKFLLPPWLFAYTFRTALNIVDLVVNKYKPKLPQLLDQGIKQVRVCGCMCISVFMCWLVLVCAMLVQQGGSGLGGSVVEEVEECTAAVVL